MLDFIITSSKLTINVSSYLQKYIKYPIDHSSSILHSCCVIVELNSYLWCFECTLKNLTCLCECEVLNKYVELNIQ